MMKATTHKKKMTRGEKMFLVAPLFVLLITFGMIRLRQKTILIKPRLIIHESNFQSYANRYTFSTLSPNGKYVLAAGGYGAATVWLYDANSGKKKWVRRLYGPSEYLFHLAVSPDNRTFAIGNSIFDLLTNNPVRQLTNVAASSGSTDTGEPAYPAFSPDGKTIAFGDFSQCSGVRLWNLQSGLYTGFLDKRNKKFTPFKESFLHRIPCFSLDGRLLACIAGGGIKNRNGYIDSTWRTGNRVQIWIAKTGKLLRVLPKADCTAFAFSPDAKRVAVTSSSPSISVYDVTTGSLNWTYNITYQTNYDPSAPASATGIVFSPNGQSLAAQDQLGRVTILDKDGRLIQTFASPKPRSKYSSEGVSPILSFSQDGKKLMSRFGDYIYLWNTDDWN